MKKRFVIGLLLFAGLVQAQMQTITGSFPQLKGGKIILKGYEGFQEKELVRAECDSTGHFTLSYPASYTGAALLQLNEAGNAIVMLKGENFSMQWTDTKDINTLSFTGSPENDAFIRGFTVNRDADQKLAGLNYLLPQYEKYPEKYRWLKEETAFQKKQFDEFVNSLSVDGYVAYYLKMRKLVTELTQALQNKNECAPQHVAVFKKINFADDRLWNSGLMSELFGGIYQLLSSGIDTNKAGARINEVTDAWIMSLTQQPLRQQEVAEYCFKILEQHNLTSASEHIALSMLDQTACQLDVNRTRLFEQYRKMAIGQTAPDLVLQNGKRLSKTGNGYKLLVFGASWCPNCQRDYPSLVGSYKSLKGKVDVEFVYISLDTEKKAFGEFFKDAPFTVSCDWKGWESEAARAYYLIATPVYFLLDRDLKILAKLKTPEELSAFLIK